MKLRVFVLGAGTVAGSLALPKAAAQPPAAAPSATATVRTGGDVRSRGAKGDGVADDSAAIQAACAAGGDVLMPPGTYAVSRPIELSGRVRILGAGATIVSSAPTGALFTATGDLAGFVMRDLVLRTTRKDSERRGEALVSVDYHSVDGALFENVTFDTGSSYQNGISIAAQKKTHVTDVTIRDCAFTGASAGVEFVHHVDMARRITGVKILNSRFAHNGLKDDQYAGFAVSLSGPLSRVEVSGNDIRGYPYAGIEIVAPKAGGFEADYVIQGNTVMGTGRGIITDTGPLGSEGRISRVSIVDNVVVTNRFFQRIQGLADSIIQGNIFESRHVSASDDHQYNFVAFYDCDRILVADNAFRLELPSSEANRAVISFHGVSNSHITGNRFESSGSHVVSIGSQERASTDNSFSSNRFDHRDNGASSEPIIFEGRATTRNALVDSTIVKRHESKISSQAAGNVAAGMVTIRRDTGAVDATFGANTVAVPPADPKPR
jgi:hypothetical protein